MTRPRKHVTQWIHAPRKLRLGDIIYIQTEDSRRRAEVIALKPGSALIKYTP